MQYVFEPLHLKYNLPKFKAVKESQLVPKKPIDAPGQFSTCFLIHISSNRLHEEKSIIFPEISWFVAIIYSFLELEEITRPNAPIISYSSINS